jgi:hypothetical protein
MPGEPHRKSAKSQLFENSSCKFEPPISVNTVGFGEGEILQKIHNVSPICQDIAYSFSPNFHIHAYVSDLYISTIGLPILLAEICRPILGHMNVEIGAEAALFLEKEYIKGIFVAV